MKQVHQFHIHLVYVLELYIFFELGNISIKSPKPVKIAAMGIFLRSVTSKLGKCDVVVVVVQFCPWNCLIYYRIIWKRTNKE